MIGKGEDIHSNISKCGESTLQLTEIIFKYKNHRYFNRNQDLSKFEKANPFLEVGLQ